MPTSFISSSTRSPSARPARSVCSFSTSAICQPTVKTGFNDVIGSWKMTEMSLPRILRSSSSEAVRRLRPAKEIRLSSPTIAFSGSSRTIDIAETLLPEPDSPTSASVPFSGTSKLMSRTASTTRCLPSLNETSRFWTERSVLIAISDQARHAAHR